MDLCSHSVMTVYYCFFFYPFVQPPALVLQSIVTLFVAEKQHVKLAELVKLAVHKGVMMDKGFCQKALVELRCWGRDPDSISAVYKLLRKLDEGTSLHATPATATQRSLSKIVNHTHEKVISPCLSISLTASSTSSPPPPPPPSQPWSGSVTLGAEASHSSSTVPASMSLKSVLHSSLPGSEKDNLSSILKLIEVRINILTVLLITPCTLTVLSIGFIWRMAVVYA